MSSQIVRRIKRLYPSVIKRFCSDCKYYAEGLCKMRGNMPVSGVSVACEIYFLFRDVSCSICEKRIKNYCPYYIYVRNLREAKKFGYDGMEFSVYPELNGYAILCLECWKEGIRARELTYGESGGEEVEE